MLLTVKDLFNRIQTNPQDYAINIPGLNWFVVLGVTDNAVTIANNTKTFGMTLICQPINFLNEKMSLDPASPVYYIGMGQGNIVEVLQKTIPRIQKKTL